MAEAQNPGVGASSDAGSERGVAGRGLEPPAGAPAPLAVALAPTVRGVKRELCKRLGVRYADLEAGGREAVDLYARARAKLAAIDAYLERHPMLDEKGEPLPCMALYSTLLNTSGRLLGQVLSVVDQMGRADDALRRHLDETYGGEK